MTRLLPLSSRRRSSWSREGSAGLRRGRRRSLLASSTEYAYVVLLGFFVSYVIFIVGVGFIAFIALHLLPSTPEDCPLEILNSL